MEHKTDKMKQIKQENKISKMKYENINKIK